MKTIVRAGLFFIVMSLLTGIFYPAIITVIAQLFWPVLCHGNLIKEGNNVRGSAIIAQAFTGDEYFWPRPSASDYSALPSSASNLGPTSKKLKLEIALRRERMAKAHDALPEEVPESLITTSGSGLDPDITLEAAMFQAHRVAKARKLDDKGLIQLTALIEQKANKSFFSSPSSSYINVLLINLALDEAFGKIKR
ncbi:MAG TPA: potassium-transporting ATPase subunit KdpC [Myxococcota bacterium]|nr:potassium-transporting ATPase subunit KdpC [Myxococcota bacterium]